MAKLFCSRIVNKSTVTNKPNFVEDMITEIPEKVFLIDGYDVAERLLEGIPFTVYFDENGVTEVKIEDDYNRNYFEDNMNSKRWYDEVKQCAELILDEGDEVEVPKFIKDKYFKDGINAAYIINENA